MNWAFLVRRERDHTVSSPTPLSLEEDGKKFSKWCGLTCSIESRLKHLNLSIVSSPCTPRKIHTSSKCYLSCLERRGLFVFGSCLHLLGFFSAHSIWNLSCSSLSIASLRPKRMHTHTQYARTQKHSILHPDLVDEIGEASDECAADAPVV